MIQPSDVLVVAIAATLRRRARRMTRREARRAVQTAKAAWAQLRERVARPKLFWVPPWELLRAA